MKLVRFSVTNFRSITEAYRLPVHQLTVLIGPNNQGKSNILRALVIALETLSQLGGLPLRRGRAMFARGALFQLYNWDEDCPVSLQEDDDAKTTFKLYFELDADELRDFESEVKSTLDGNLPIELSFGKSQAVGFKVAKKGPGAKGLSAKKEQIAKFVAARVSLTHIQAVRTAESAERAVTQLVERELRRVESTDEYRNAAKALRALQDPVFKALGDSIRDTLKVLLSDVTKVEIRTGPAETVGTRRHFDVLVDDGASTPLSRKGDGVQSLAALGIMRHVSENAATTSSLILAIEEPESHLHPRAIRELRKVVADIADKQQVIMTTHHPIFVQRLDIKANVIVQDGKATEAKSLEQIRDVLGVRAADNLLHAELILLVEGEDDRRSLRAILAQKSGVLAGALTNQTLGIESLLGGSNLSYKAGHVKEMLCEVHAFLDNDQAATEAQKRALAEGVIETSEVTKATCIGRTESELEDLYDEKIYEGLLKADYNVDLSKLSLKGGQKKEKWSNRMYRFFQANGQDWDLHKASVKNKVSLIAAAAPGAALSPSRSAAIDSLVTVLESKVTAILAGKL